MSEDVMSVGVMVPLSRKLTEEEREDWQEILWNQGSDVHLSYYCDMAFTDEGGEAYGISFGQPNRCKEEFDKWKNLETLGGKGWDYKQGRQLA